MRFLTTLLAIVSLTANAVAQPVFDDVFADSTLRIDYIFSGTADDVDVSLREKHVSAGWHGRTSHLPELKYLGNDNITVTSVQGDTLYRNSFSTLFNEWLDLADTIPQAHEVSLLIPWPKQPVIVTVNVLDKRHNVIASHTQTVDPADILIKRATHGPLPYEYVHKGEYDGHKIKVAILAEGYTQDEMPEFMAHARTATKAILDHEPFKTLADRFDFIAVKSPSADSGVSVPKDNLWRNTAFGSNFSTFYSDRYLTTGNLFKVHDALLGIPYEHIIILANTDEYGGGGIFNNYTLTTARHRQFKPVVVHEFGHSFGGLADEYFYDGDVMDNTYPTDVEPWEPNVTTLVDFGSKWASLIPEGTPMPTPASEAAKYPVGLYEGAAYSFKGIYRPADVCRMRVNDVEGFCPACQASLRDLILYYSEK